MPRYWTADSDRDWQDSVGMYEEQDEFEEEPEMAQPSFTPGPWQTYVPAPEDAILILAGYEKIAGTYRCALPGEERANARLIAAAPDLLDELENARVIIAGEAPQYDQALKRIDAALAKAKGEP